MIQQVFPSNNLDEGCFTKMSVIGFRLLVLLQSNLIIMMKVQRILNGIFSKRNIIVYNVLLYFIQKYEKFCKNFGCVYVGAFLCIDVSKKFNIKMLLLWFVKQSRSNERYLNVFMSSNISTPNFCYSIKYLYSNYVPHTTIRRSINFYHKKFQIKYVNLFKKKPRKRVEFLLIRFWNVFNMEKTPLGIFVTEEMHCYQTIFFYKT